MSQKTSKRFRKAIKEMVKEQEQFARLMYHFRQRLPMWRVLSYIKWEIEWRRLLDN